MSAFVFCLFRSFRADKYSNRKWFGRVAGVEPLSVRPQFERSGGSPQRARPQPSMRIRLSSGSVFDGGSVGCDSLNHLFGIVGRHGLWPWPASPVSRRSRDAPFTRRRSLAMERLHGWGRGRLSVGRSRRIVPLRKKVCRGRLVWVRRGGHFAAGLIARRRVPGQTPPRMFVRFPCQNQVG